MDLRAQISAAVKQAMRDKAAERLSTLRLISAAIKDKEIELRGKGADTAVGDDDILAILGKMTKQRMESARAYEEGGRAELAENEKREIAILEEFLPRQLDEAEITAAIDAAIAEAGAESLRDMGKVMGVLKSKYTVQMDFGRVGPMVKAKLG